eukprot:9103951-Lingulodinium_polyedra.AAC.1
MARKKSRGPGIMPINTATRPFDEYHGTDPKSVSCNILKTTPDSAMQSHMLVKLLYYINTTLFHNFGSIDSLPKATAGTRAA